MTFQIATVFTRLQHDCRDLLALMRHYELPFSENDFARLPVFTADQANNLAGKVRILTRFEIILLADKEVNEV